MKAVFFGELMLRLEPDLYTRFLQAQSYGATFGGGEANAAISLAQFGIDASFVSKIPAHDVGQAAVNSLRAFGVDTSDIVRGGDRLGIYFIEKGASVRPSKVIYDRAGSAIAAAERTDFDWDKILDGADWFHFTGITPALSDTLAEITFDALKTCRKKGITVSCDPNYRKALWSKEKAGKVMSEFMPYVNVIISNDGQADDLFGIRADGLDSNDDSQRYEASKSIAAKLKERFGFDKVALTFRESISASDNNWSAMIYDGCEYAFSKKYSLHIVDRVGGGDSFAAGLIYSLMTGKTPADSIEFATAASALKHTVEGDVNIASVAEVESLIKTGGSGKIQR